MNAALDLNHPQPPVLLANQVEKTYSNGTHALQRLKLSVGRGEFVSLLPLRLWQKYLVEDVCRA